MHIILGHENADFDAIAAALAAHNAQFPNEQARFPIPTGAAGSIGAGGRGGSGGGGGTSGTSGPGGAGGTSGSGGVTGPIDPGLTNGGGGCGCAAGGSHAGRFASIALAAAIGLVLCRRRHGRASGQRARRP